MSDYASDTLYQYQLNAKHDDNVFTSTIKNGEFQNGNTVCIKRDFAENLIPKYNKTLKQLGKLIKQYNRSPNKQNKLRQFVDDLKKKYYDKCQGTFNLRGYLGYKKGCTQIDKTKAIMDSTAVCPESSTADIGGRRQRKCTKGCKRRKRNNRQTKRRKYGGLSRKTIGV